MGRLLIISIVGVPEQKILLTTGMLLSISLDAAHKAEGEISCLDLNPRFCLPTLPLASSVASRRVLILEQKAIVSNKTVSQAEKQWGKSSRLVWFRVSILWKVTARTFLASWTKALHKAILKKKRKTALVEYSLSNFHKAASFWWCCSEVSPWQLYAFLLWVLHMRILIISFEVATVPYVFCFHLELLTSQICAWHY